MVERVGSKRRIVENLGVDIVTLLTHRANLPSRRDRGHLITGRSQSRAVILCKYHTSKKFDTEDYLILAAA
jgi:hypothetical protein